MKYRSYIIAVCATLLCTTVGLFLPTWNLTQKNRTILNHTGSRATNSTALSYHSSLEDALRILCMPHIDIQGYEITDYDNLTHTSEEIFDKIRDFQKRFTAYGIDLGGLESSPLGKGLLVPCLIIPTTDEDSSTYEKESDKVAFVWVYEMYSEDGYLHIIADDSSGYVIAFQYQSEKYYKQFELYYTHAVDNPQYLADNFQEFFSSYYEDTPINVSVESAYTSEKWDNFYPLQYTLHYTLKSKGNTTDKELPFTGRIQIHEAGISMNLFYYQQDSNTSDA